MKLEDLQVDTHVAGIEASTPVKLLNIPVIGEDAAEVAYELLDGRPQEAPPCADEATIELASEKRTGAFDTSPECLKALEPTIHR